MNVAYATLDETRAVMNSKTTAQDTELRQYPGIASKRIDQLMLSPRRPFFAPYYEARKIRVTSDRINSYDGILSLGMPLLALVSVVAGTTTLTVGTDVDLFPDDTMPPFSMLRLSGTCPYDWGYYGVNCSGCGYTPYFVTVTGWWGYSNDYANAWLAVDTLAAAMTDTTTRTFTVTDVNAANALEQTPRFSPLAIIKIDSEVMVESKQNTSTNVVTVQARGALGSTAATHLINAPIYVWQVEEDIKQETARQAGLLYARRGAYTTVEAIGMTEIRYPSDLLQSLKNVVWSYANA